MLSIYSTHIDFQSGFLGNWLAIFLIDVSVSIYRCLHVWNYMWKVKGCCIHACPYVYGSCITKQLYRVHCHRDIWLLYCVVNSLPARNISTPRVCICKKCYSMNMIHTEYCVQWAYECALHLHFESHVWQRWHKRSVSPHSPALYIVYIQWDLNSLYVLYSMRRQHLWQSLWCNRAWAPKVLWSNSSSGSIFSYHCVVALFLIVTE